jgi:hypothetical protein
MKQLPGQYVLSKFYTYSGEPVFRKFDGNYNASCPVCREGKSWLKKKRLYFYPTTNSFYCFNCNKSWNALNWISEVSNLSREEVLLEAQSGGFSTGIEVSIEHKQAKKERLKLPHDSINLFNSLQQNFYLKNEHFKQCLEYVNSRRMDTAINSSKHFYVSLTDTFHGNRLCIPYTDRSGKIVFYQTRSVDGSEPRYLNKIGSDKSVFNLDRIDINLDKIFLFEGPIDAMFVKNGVSLAGLVMTKTQESQLSEFLFHEKIWILDNPQKDEAAKDKIFQLLKAKQKVFRWPLNSPYKDFNEWAVKEGRDEIPLEFIVNSLY